MANLYEYCNSGLNLNNYISLSYWLGQSFTPLTTHTLNSFKFYMRKASGGTGTIAIKVFLASGNKPTGSVLAQTTYNVADLSTSAAWVTIPLVGVQLNVGTSYFVSVGISSGAGQPAYIYMRNTSGYTRGIMSDSSNGGAFWNNLPNYDLGFEDWGDPATIETSAASNIETTTADLNGNLVTATGIDQVGFDYGTVSGTYTSEVLGSPTPGAFSLSITGLTEATCYYYRAKAHHTTYGWIYATELVFQTDPDPVLVQFEKFITGDNAEFAIGSSNQWFCQTFTSSVGHAIKSVRLYGRRVGTTGILTVSIRATDGLGKPTGGDLCSGLIDMSLTPVSNDWLEIGFGAGVTLIGGTKYAIVARVTSSLLFWRYNNSGGYSGGQFGSAIGGTGWAMGSSDFLFQELGESGIETYAASEVEAYTAQGNGFMYDATDVTQVGFEWGTTLGGPYPNSVVDTSGTYFEGLFGMTMTALNATTLYYYRAKVYNSVYGWLYGNEMPFVTHEPTPRVRTDPPTDCQLDHVDAVGYIEGIGGGNCDRRGFVASLTSHSDPGESVAPEDSSYEIYAEDVVGSYGVGSFGVEIPGLEAGRFYYIRAFAHNAWGFDYGGQIGVLTNPDVNILQTTSDYSKGVRFDSGPGGHWPNHLSPGEVRTPHYLLMRSKDCVGGPGTFGSITGGGYIYERQCYGSALYTDLFGLANPWRRTEGILKVKWKANVMNNFYPGSNQQFRKIQTHGVVYTGAAIGAAWPDGSYICEIFYNNLNTGVPWTVAEADALIAGIELGNDSGWGTPACDWLCCYVLWANASVRCDPSEKIDGTTLRLNGYVIQDEGEECEVFFEWGLTTAYGNTTANQVKRLGEFFTADITGLDPLETYHVRAGITTACGETFYSTDSSYNMYHPDRIYVWLGTVAVPETHELTDPDNPLVVGVRTERGRDEELGHAAAGTAEITCDNFNGDFSPENPAGLFFGELVLGAVITVYEVYKGIQYDHFKGKIDKIDPDDDPKNIFAYILAVDGMDDMAGTEIDTPLRTTTETGELVADVLDAVEWPAAPGGRTLDAGSDVLEIGYFDKTDALQAINQLEETENGFFYIDVDGKAIWENRHHRLLGAHLTSQHDFTDEVVKIKYEYSKRNLKNAVRVTGYKYTPVSGETLLWSVWSGGTGCPYIESGGTLELWARTEGPIYSYTTPVANTHWNANASADGLGTNLTSKVSLVVTQYGQALKLVFTSTANQKAYLVPPTSPPAAAPTDQTALVYGYIYDEAEFTVQKKDQTSIDAYGKRSKEIDAHFKANPNDITAYADWLLLRYKDPVPTPVGVNLVARTNWPDDIIRIQCLSRKISDRITLASTRLAFDKDFFINKVIQDYLFLEGGVVHETEWFVESAEGSAEGAFWLLGVVGFSELGSTTILGF